MSDRERKRELKSRPLSLSFKSDRPLTEEDVNDVMRHMMQNQDAVDQNLRDAVGKLARESEAARETLKRLSTPPPAQTSAAKPVTESEENQKTP